MSTLFRKNECSYEYTRMFLLAYALIEEDIRHSFDCFTILSVSLCNGYLFSESFTDFRQGWGFRRPRQDNGTSDSQICHCGGKDVIFSL